MYEVGAGKENVSMKTKVNVLGRVAEDILLIKSLLNYVQEGNNRILKGGGAR